MHDGPAFPKSSRASRRRCSREGGPFEIVDVEVDGVTIRSFKNRIRTLRDLLVKSVDFGDNTYMLATDGVDRAPAQLRRARAPRRVGRGRVPRPLRRAARRPGRDPRRELPRVGDHVLGGDQPRRDRGRAERLVDRARRSATSSTTASRRCSSPTASGVERLERRSRRAGGRRWKTTSPSWRRTRPTRGFADARGRRGRSRDHPLHVGHDRPAEGCDQHAPQRGVVPDDQLLQRRQGGDARAGRPGPTIRRRSRPASSCRARCSTCRVCTARR